MRFCFTIRDLLWLTLVVALGVGWWLDRSHVAAERTEWMHRAGEAEDEAQSARNSHPAPERKPERPRPVDPRERI
jgi:hypothetical protein